MHKNNNSYELKMSKNNYPTQYLLLVCIYIHMALTVSAQTNSCRTDGKQNTLSGSLFIEAVNSFKNKGMTMHAFDLSLGIYPTKHIGVCGMIEHNSIHSRSKSPRTYGNTLGFAGGLCAILHNNELEVKLQYGKDSGDEEYNNTFYDARLHYAPKLFHCKLLNISIGAGIRYAKFKSDTLPNCIFPSFSIGIGL